jgi:hypothetical protein
MLSGEAERHSDLAERGSNEAEGPSCEESPVTEIHRAEMGNAGTWTRIHCAAMRNG